jgi:hypothetical protein
MNTYWVYNIPDWLFTLLCVFVAVVIGVGGMFATRRWVSGLHHAFSHNELVSYYLGAVGVFYGITLGLIAIGTWQNYSDVEEKATLETASIASLWRDISSYPEPTRTILHDYLRNYTRGVIDYTWPLQRKGLTPPSGSAEHLYFIHFQETLFQFEPTTNGQMALHSEALRQFNTLTTLRRLRFRSVTYGLPATMWVLVLVGALVNLAVTWFFRANNISVHFWMTLLLSVILGLLIHMLAAVDNPYRGKVSVGPDAFELVYQQLMKPGA